MWEAVDGTHGKGDEEAPCILSTETRADGAQNARGESDVLLCDTASVGVVGDTERVFHARDGAELFKDAIVILGAGVRVEIRRDPEEG